MPVLIKSKKFFNTTKNDPLFSSNLTSYDTILRSNVMERVKAAFEVEMYYETIIKMEADVTQQSNSFGIVNTSTGTYYLYNNAGTWESFGFSLGDQMDIFLQTIILAATVGGIAAPLPIATITYINGNYIEYTFASALSASEANVLDNMVFHYNQLEVIGRTSYAALKYSFGLIENGEGFNIANKVTGDEQSFWSAGINSGTPTLETLGPIKGWVTGEVTCTYDGGRTETPTLGTDLRNTSRRYYSYTITHEFNLLPYYNEGQEPNIPYLSFADEFSGLNCLKYANEFEFRKIAADPNSSVTTRIEDVDGDTGSFDENFNGLNPNYEVVSIAYEENGTGFTASGVMHNADTDVTVVLLKPYQTWVVGQDIVSLAFSHLAPSTEYLGATDTYTDVFMLELKQFAVNAIGVSGAILNDIIAVISTVTTADDTLTITFTTEFTAAQKLRLDTDKKYILAAICGDLSLTAALSNRVTLYLDHNFYDENPDIPGLMTPLALSFQDYCNNYSSVDLYTNYDSLDLWIEDGFNSRFVFEIELSLGAVLDSMTWELVAYNSTSGEYFIVDSYDFDLTGTVIVNNGTYDIQTIDLAGERGFQLITGDGLNKWKAEDFILVGSAQRYDFEIASKVNWQNWIANNNVDTVFYDSAEPENNLNDRTSNYSGLEGYQIKVFWKAGMSCPTGTTDYITGSQDFTIYDYGDGFDKAYTCAIETYKESDFTVSLGGAILGNAPTYVRAVFTHSSPITNIIDNYGILRIDQASAQSNNTIMELHTSRPYPADNKLKPISGQTGAYLYISGNDVYLEGYVDHNELTSGVNYILSTRWGTCSSSLPTANKLKESGADKLQEGGGNKQVE